MKRFLSITILISIFTLVFIDCSKSDDDDNPGNTFTGIGVWKLSLPPIPGILTDTMNLDLNINTDKTYEITVLERSDKTLFSSKGTWNNTADSVYLSGEECLKLDTTATPPSLTPLEDSICSLPIVLGIPQNTNEWAIKTSNLSAALSALSISKSQLDMIYNLVQTVKLKR